MCTMLKLKSKSHHLGMENPVERESPFLHLFETGLIIMSLLLSWRDCGSPLRRVGENWTPSCTALERAVPAREQWRAFTPREA